MNSNTTDELPTIRRWATAACALLFWAAGALAQDSFRIGPFGVRSQVSSSVNWTDNLSNTSGAKEDGYWFTASTHHYASTRLYDRHSLFIATGLGVTHYPERDDLSDVTPIGASAGLSLDYGNFKYFLRNDFSYQGRAADQFFAAGTARVDTYSNIFNAKGDATIAPWSFGANYIHGDTWYGSNSGQSVFNPQPSRRDYFAAHADFNFRAWRGLNGKLGMGYWVDWSDDKKSESVQGRAGLNGPLTPNLDLDLLLTFAITGKSSFRGDLTFRSAITSKINYSIRAGVLVTESEVSSKKRVSLILDMQISFAEGMEFPRGVRHTIGITVSPFDLSSSEQAATNTSFMDSIAVTYKLDYTPRIAQKITVSPYVRYGQTRTRGTGIRETSQILTAGIGAGYQLTKKFNLGASYQYTNRQSNLGPDREYESNTVSLTGTYVF